MDNREIIHCLSYNSELRHEFIYIFGTEQSSDFFHLGHSY